MQISPYQEQILEWVKTGSGHATCNAVAGSGKSTTLQLAANALVEAGINQRAIKIIVFGKANSEDLVKKFGSVWKDSICTMHSIGWTILKAHLGIGKGSIEANKYQAIAYNLGYMSSKSLKKSRALENNQDLIQLVNLIRLTNNLPSYNAVDKLAEHYGIVIDNLEAVADACTEIIQEGVDQARSANIFDFTDQIWLPVYFKANTPNRKFIMLDECQDLNACQTELAIALAGNTGRILAVGDPYQSVYGFAGADHDSYYNLQSRLKAKELPLSICYRCPASVVNLVNKVFPKIPIEHKSEAEMGEVKIVGKLEPSTGDLVLSRKTAPLVKECIRLIGQGINASVKGRDIGAGLKLEAEAISKIERFHYSGFKSFAENYKAYKQSKWAGKPNAAELIVGLGDKVDALIAIYEGNCFMNMKVMIAYIDQIFSDKDSPVTLCTVHRAKGLEADRVWIIEPSCMPQFWKGQKDWQFAQENNLLYVALTRAKKKLIIVGDAAWARLDKIHELKPRSFDMVLGGNSRNPAPGDMVLAIA